MRKRSSDQVTAFKVDQAVGSWAMAGACVSPATKVEMLRIARGQTSGVELQDALVEKYRQR